MQDNASVIRIGSSPMTPAQLLMQLWPKIQEHCPDLKFQIIPFENKPFCCAVSIHHRLAVKDKLKIRDLYGENLMLMRRDWSNYVDRLRDDLWQNHSQIHIIDFDFYSMEAFNRCENSNDVLLAIPGWANVHPLLKVIPVEWEHSIPFGLLHSPQPSETVKKLLEAAQMSVSKKVKEL